ncbi:MAG: D-threitol dehydrogenase [Clostridiales Family XIII bacterium]|jgi:NAD(P)-dependent dehydrogenase (short-subunit alcohol dehydrogenase family)|nr:D-threitol dehydrogenase [Clostridiales Family XIII bacterium]
MAAYQGFDINFDLSGKIAIVTGGARGIGNAIAKMYAEKGASVVIFGKGDNVFSAAEEIGKGALAIKMDVSSLPDIDRAVAEVMERCGRIDVLCNVAGVGSETAAVDMTEAEWDRILNINLKGCFFLTKAVGAEMIRAGTGGKIINISSQAAILGMWGHVAYGASKAALLNMGKVLANEWSRYGININAISPSLTRTPMAEIYWNGEKGEGFLQKMPIGRMAEPDEMAAVAVFLASDAANMITGQNIVVDGGCTAVF